MNTKFTTARRKRYLEALSSGKRRGDAAKCAGVDRHTVRNAIKSDPEFGVECEDAEVSACDVIENALWEKAKAGNVTAILVYLFNRSGGRWSDKRYVKPANEVQDLTPEMIKDQLKARGIDSD